MRILRILSITASVLAVGVFSSAGEEPEKRKANRLIGEKSPYLLQHAYNPVDWYPWGEEAFTKAREENKPIFLSIGYATCHWCHVMERESFENEKIAEILNKHFVPIKVDREERPDVDEVYMTAVTTLFSRGGWPLSVFLTPDRKPFFGGTYFPPEDIPGRGSGFRPLLLKIHEVWTKEGDKLKESSDQLLIELKRRLALSAGGGAGISAQKVPELTLDLLEDAVSVFQETHDRTSGGFGTQPKFPRTTVLDFLLFQSLRSGSREARSMVLLTLDQMARGGIRDYLAGGYHRYSTDRTWTVPHFEKMLYDQALISRTYLEAGKLTGESRYFEVAREILDYVLQRLTHEEGGFFCAEDADSDGVEGKCYVWTRNEAYKLLGKDDGKIFCEYYGVSEKGNFEEAGHGQNVLTSRRDIEDVARKMGIGPEDLSRKLREWTAKLLPVRDRRVQPAKDDKVLTDWNGLMISAFAVAYEATGETRYLRAAQRAADFITRTMVEDGNLLHRFRGGSAGIAAFLEDYSFLSAGLLDLYEADFDLSRLRESIRLVREMIRLHWDEKEGGFFQTSENNQVLILRRKEFYDGAIPSGNSLAYLTLARLVELTGDPDFTEKVRVLDGVAAGLAARSPTQHPLLLKAIAFRLSSPRQIVVVAGPGDPAAAAMVKEVHRRYLPARVLTRVAPGEIDSLKSLIPLVDQKVAMDGKATAYVCRGGTCKLPARDLKTFQGQLVGN